MKSSTIVGVIRNLAGVLGTRTFNQNFPSNHPTRTFPATLSISAEARRLFK
jgi:hypothetical protein